MTQPSRPVAEPADPWLTESLDLDAYLAKVGVDGEPPSLDALTRLQTAHVRAFTFDNIDVLLGKHPGVSLAAIQEKFVGRGRGGYCFEHSTIFAAAWNGSATRCGGTSVGSATRAAAGRTHMVVEVVSTVSDCCATRASAVPARPDPTRRPGRRDHARVATRHTGSRRTATLMPGKCAAHRREWELVHTIDTLPVRPVDVAMGHHWTSTKKTSHFTTSLMCVAHGVD